MRIIDPTALERFCKAHPGSRPWLERWLATVQAADWGSIQDIRAVYPSADGVKTPAGSVVTVFNVGGNKYRLLTAISYRLRVIQPLDLLTHAEYSRERWKDSI